MEVKNLLQYYDYLARIAASKTVSQSDAEDLVSETMLAALRIAPIVIGFAVSTIISMEEE